MFSASFDIKLFRLINYKRIIRAVQRAMEHVLTNGCVPAFCLAGQSL